MEVSFLQTYESLSAKERITEEFFILLKEKPCKNISVSEIVKKCGINRSTFYRNYTDIFDLYDKTCDEVIEQTVNTQAKLPPEKSKRYIESLCKAYYEAATDNVEKISVLYKGNGEVRFLYKIRAAWCDDIFSRIKEFDLASDKDLSLHVDKAVVYFILNLLIPLSNNSEYMFDKYEYVLKIFDTYTIDYSKNLIENLLVLGEDGSFSSKLYYAAINFWGKTAEKVAPFSIKELCNKAYISRTLFYTKYKGIFDFINEMAIGGLSILSRFVLDCALTDIDKEIDAFSFINLGENTVKAFNGCLKSDERTPFIFEVYRTTRKYFLDHIEKTKGTEYLEQNRKELEKYIFAVAYNIIETLVSQDKEAFEIRLASYKKLRERLKF